MKNRKLYSLLRKVKKLIPVMEGLTDEELQGKTLELKDRLKNGATTDSILPEAFAVICEADRRILGMLPYDVQILGGIAMHLCYLAEMNTGEGKTLTATLPLYLNALTGKSTILVTANEYLAARDAEEMGAVYNFLGLSVGIGVTQHPGERFTNDEKREIYSKDIVYTTHGTLGFDYLFDNLVTRAEDRYMREFCYVIIDEADSVLLDAATMPLVISGAPRVQSNLYKIADFFVTTLEEGRDYELEDKKVWLTEKGVKYAEQYFGIKNFYSKKNFEINRHVTLALRAHKLFEKERDYVVSKDNEIVLLDNGSGRSLPGMKMRGGQHQSLEIKEKVKLSNEFRSVASVTYQNLFLMFPNMSGMSGTISDARRELKKVYGKHVEVIPPNKPLARKDLQDYFYATAEKQFEAAVEDAVKRHEKGQPVLMVTPTIGDTELVSKLLVEKKVPHSVLNANNAYWEAQIIKEAGQYNAVTVSTGMAGRGTDIKLGKGVRELGGLAVIGVGRMGNTRQERQARGRAGRQGDPGCSRFYVSLEDEVAQSLGEEKLEKYTEKNHPISKAKLKRLINGSQSLGEEQAVNQRKSSQDYDKVLKKQRQIIYESRNRLLDGMSMEISSIYKMLDENIEEFLKNESNLNEQKISAYILNNLTYRLGKGGLRVHSTMKMEVRKLLQRYAKTAMEQREHSFPADRFEEFIRMCALQALDEAWVEQVDYLQQLQAAVAGRSSAQRNPIYEYQAEAYKSYKAMVKAIKSNITRNILLADPNFDKYGNMHIIFP